MKILFTFILFLSTGASAIEASNSFTGVEVKQIVSSYDEIKSIASSSKCASYRWKNRGQAKAAYFEGMALVYARSVCHIENPEVEVVAAARKLPEKKWDKTDALSWFNSNFKKLGMYNDTSGVDTLRHSYTLLTGLGMRESSGQYCEGRDVSANYVKGESAEAGLFQASYGAKRNHRELEVLYSLYTSTARPKCLLEEFSKNVSCGRGDAKNWGTGEGVRWQQLTKTCPAFAVEYAAILLRTSGGNGGEFGPLKRKHTEINPDCDSMYKKVETVVKNNPSVCQFL